MKFRLTYLILFVIVIIHIAFFKFFFTIPKPKTDKPEGDKPKTEEQAQPVQPGTGPQLPGPQLPPKAGSSPAMVAIAPFNAGFFRQDFKQLPAELNKMMAAVPACVVVDLDGRRVLFAKDAQTARPIASITKMMTTYLAVKKMRDSNGALTLNTPIKVSSAASQVKERRVWLSPKETFTFDELLKASLVHSANDCAYLLAEFLGGGNEQAFVADMNKEAASIGCNSLKYYNANGLPTANGKENMGSPIELAYLSLHLMKYPEIMKWTGVKVEYLRENDAAFIKRNGGATMLTSSNKLLGKCRGVNGMKTGYTNKAGHCIVATCEREGRRMAVVILGATKERDRIASNLIEWAYKQP
ncbi:MAG: D-alanyl-D-alanine carboxypeptidase [Victivallales bacterium]|nr:D-alanyl-D-alanine carboxypeptidase [Victivallales bacterium]